MSRILSSQYFESKAKTRKRRRNSVRPGTSGLELLEPRVVLAANPMISEFQASNSSTIADSQGDFEDWIEVQNSSSEAINLDGWYLTDDPDNLTKWRFPAVTVGANDELLVFASNKDLTDPNSELHTNFRLSANGDYLALVEPNGTTISQEFAPEYPEQLTDQSYGLGLKRTTSNLVEFGDAAKFTVPTGVTAWTTLEYDDSAWTDVNTPVGFEQTLAGFTITDDFATQDPAWTVTIPAGGTGTATFSGGKLNLTVPDGDAIGGDGTRGVAPTVTRALPANTNSMYEFEARFTGDQNDDGRIGLTVIDGDTGLPAFLFVYDGTRFQMEDSNGEQIARKTSRNQDVYSMRVEFDESDLTWGAYYKLAETDDWSIVGRGTEGAELPLIGSPQIGFALDGSSGSMEAAVESFQFTTQDSEPLYGPTIISDVEAAMAGNNASSYLRFPFAVDGDPSRFSDMNLSFQGDDGFVAFLNGEEIATYNVPFGYTWDSAASSSVGERSIPKVKVDVSAHISKLRTGQNVLAIQAMNFAADDHDFYANVNLAASEVIAEAFQVFVSPTPGEPNDLPAAGAPIIKTANGAYFTEQTIEMELAEANPNLEIRYTTDGSEPESNSTLYEGPFTITASAMLQARTFDKTETKGFEPSNVANGTFFILDESLREVSSNLPIIVLDTLDGSLPATGSTTLRGVTVMAIEVDRTTGRATIVDGDIDYIGRGGVRDRGSSTSGQPKPNMAFETWGTEGTTQDDDDDVGLLGLAPESDWVLHAPYTFDRSLIHNQFAFDISNQLGQWAPDFRQVEVYFNRNGDAVSDADYGGIYVLMEKIEQGKDRVDIEGISPEVTATPEENPDSNISGGYIWKIDRTDPDGGSFNVPAVVGDRTLNIGMNWVYPKGPNVQTNATKATEQQEQWVQQYFEDFSRTLENPDINDPNGYIQYVDIEAWVESHLVNVLTMNVDAIRLSGYLYKDMNGKIQYGPVWDFDRAMESNDDRDDDPLAWRGQGGDNGTDFFGTQVTTISDGMGPRWYKPLFEDPGFWQAYVDTWQELRHSTLSDENILATIDRLSGELTEAAPRNFEKWRGTSPRTTSLYKHNTLDGTWEGEINNLKTWLLERAHFMDSNFASQVIVSVAGVRQSDDATGVIVSPGQGIEVNSEPLVINNDTELISGVNGVADAKFFVPVNDDLGESWTSLTFDDSAWQSGKLGVGMGATDRNEFGDHYTTELDPRTVNPDATNVFIRIPFTLDSLDGVEQLILRMKYDDGFVASINGEIVQEKNIRDTPWGWNTRATNHANPDAIEFEEFNITEHIGKLRIGENVLAIRGMNSSATSNDLLFLPGLVSRFLTFEPSPSGKIYYTTDGTDPRAPDGTVNASATLLAKGQTLSFASNTQIVARNFDDSDRGRESRIVLTDWGAPRTINYLVSQPQLAITEINYNPVGATTAELAVNPNWKDGDFEFIEITNVGTTTADLTGVRIGDGARFEFAHSNVTSLAPGASTVVVSDTAAFQQRYGNAISIAGEFAGDLDNNGEDIDLRSGTDEVIFGVRYSDADPWPVAADGVGATLELVDLNVSPDRSSKYYSWRSSREFNGTPGSQGAGGVGVVINEVFARPSGNDQDQIELFNTTDTTIDISGWYLSDSSSDLLKYKIPAGTVLTPGKYTTFNESTFGTGANSFGLGADGDSVWLVRADKDGNITAFVDNVTFGGSQVGESFGRLPNGSGRLVPLDSRTFGSDNGSPRIGPLVISEINYNPAAATADALAIYPALDAADLEFVEIHNPTAAAVTLTDWRLRGGIDFSFEDGSSLAAGGTLVIVSFNVDNPENAARVAAFRANFGIGDDVTILGGYGGQLNNADDEVRLLQPSADGDNIVRFLSDEVLYDDLAPWPTNADGNGGSLQRREADTLGTLSSSWVGNPATPGTAVFGVGVQGDFDGNGIVDANDIDLLSAQVRVGGGDLAFDLNGDGAVNNADRVVLVKNVLNTFFGDSNLDGIFNSSDLVFIFVAGEYEDGVPNNSTWAEGDWNGDGDFTTLDLVTAFQDGGYVRAVKPIASNVAGALGHSATDEPITVQVTADADVAEHIQTRKADLIDAESMDEVFAGHEDHWQADDIIASLLEDEDELLM
ncbi:MAG: lamin tail domain-containing protein [Planctomycetales bacterium]|nr:lamin tail domain-containing protein [Planctomycetales bacterium]